MLKKISPLFYTFLLICLSSFLFGEELLKPDFTLHIPMRDGVKLPTDFYLPSPDAKGLPCILLRSPAGRSSHWKEIISIAKEGYLVAIQETRNALDPEGKTLPFLADGWGAIQDGYDTVEWLANSPYTNGKIGTWGASALGITQLLMAPSNPPHLQCQYIVVAAASLYHHGMYPGGQLLKNQAEGWLGYYARDTGVLGYVSQRPFYNQFWEQLNTLSVADKVQVPAIHIGGWYDTFLQGTLSSFKSRQEEGGKGARGKQKLVIGPWTHFWPLVQTLGDFEIPVAGQKTPLDISPKRWFDHYLKGISNEVETIPNVTYYVMGPFDGSSSSGNVWRTAETWPVPASLTPFYLTEKGGLKTTMPKAETAVSYSYNPKNPVPTLGGRNLFLESGPKDQQLIEQRDDVLVFTTPPLEEDIEVTGDLSAKLFFSSDQKDTDIVVRLCDVYPDGRSILVADGAYRLSVMRYNEQNELTYQPGQIVEANVDLWATSLVFAKGHQIRVSITSSNYPRYEKNLNIGILGENAGIENIAKNRLIVGSKHPSQILLPIVKR